MIKRIHTNNTVKVIDKDSPNFGDTGVVIGVVSKPVGMRLRNHLQVRLVSTDTVEEFLPEQLEVIS
jgi:hypothetical protein